MGVTCAARLCKNKSYNCNKKFFRFPTDVARTCIRIVVIVLDVKEIVSKVAAKRKTAEDPMSSTSTAHLTTSADLEETYFSSDVSVDDPLCTPNNEEHSTSSSGVEEMSVPVPPLIPTNIVPKISLCVLKKEKKTKSNMGQCYKTLKGKPE
ncbi:hypothetical protein JTB14_004672 [Gonioctena quinquepunctata]|nr:hypothetical protein JTB14_004672 [Gonioctena quinquepunctata]